MDYTKTVGYYLREELNKRGWDRLSQKEIWKKCRFKKSPELYRKIFFDDYHTDDYNVYDEIAKALELDSKEIRLLANINLAPSDIKDILITNLNLTSVSMANLPSKKWTTESLERHVKTMYKVEGYNVQEDINYNIGRESLEVPLVFEHTSRLSFTRHAVWVIINSPGSSVVSSSKINPILDTIESLKSFLPPENHIDKYIIITSSEIKGEQVFHNGRIEIVEIKEFDNRYFSHAKYLESICNSWHKRLESSYYRDLSGEIQKGLEIGTPEHVPSVGNILGQWLNSDSPFLFVHGSFGTGKSTFVRKNASALAEAKLNNTSSWSPVVIPLRDYPNIGWSGIVNKILPNFLEAQLDLQAARKHYKEFVANGQFVLLFDGLDEYELSFSKEHHKTISDEFSSILKYNGGVEFLPKVIITFRREMFPNDQDMVDFMRKVSKNSWVLKLNLMSQEEIGGLLADILGTNEDGGVDKLQEDIDKLCSSLTKENSGRAIENSALNRPLVLELIGKNWKDLRQYDDITPMQIHKLVVDNWLKREDNKGRRNLPPNHKTDFIYWLAEWVEKSGEGLKLNYKNFPIDLCQRLNRNSPEELDSSLEHEIRVSTFLERDSKGNYFFTYNSFKQYCYSASIKQQISNNLPSFFGYTNLVKRTDGLMIDFLLEMSEPNWRQILWDWITSAKLPGYLKFGKHSYLTANALFLLSKIKNGDLYNSSMKNTYLGHCTLTTKSIETEEINFKNSSFKAVFFSEVNFENINFEGTTFDWVWFHNCKISNVKINNRTEFNNIIVTGLNEGDFFEIINNYQLNKFGLDIHQYSEKLIRKITPENCMFFPGGVFDIGTNRTISKRFSQYSKPEIRVSLEPLFVSLNQVTNGEFHAFVIDQAPQWNYDYRYERWGLPYYLEHWNKDVTEPFNDDRSPNEFPVIWINHNAAIEYSKYAHGRLMTEYEFEAIIKFLDIHEKEVKSIIANSKGGHYSIFKDFRDKDSSAETSCYTIWKNSGGNESKEAEKKLGFLTLIKDWCLDWATFNHAHLEKKSISYNPYTEDNYYIYKYSLEHPDSEVKRDHLRIIRGFGTGEYTPPYYREMMEDRNCNYDISFRIAFETWKVLGDQLNLKANE